MKASAIIVRLRAAAPSFGGRVAGATEFGLIQNEIDVTVPAAFVMPAGEIVSPPATAGHMTQFVIEQFAVLVVVSTIADDRGQAAADQLDDLKVELQAALLGWEPGDLYSGMEYQGGVHLDVGRARLWHQFDFATRVVLSQT